MHTGQRYRLGMTLGWSKWEFILPFTWAAVATCVYKFAGWEWIGIPWVPLSLIGVAVAFYLGFKNNASYDRLWEARKIYGAVVNASRSWAFSARDLVRDPEGSSLLGEHRLLVHRHVAWMDALRHQLRKVKSWEHDTPHHTKFREWLGAVEYKEDLAEVLGGNLPAPEVKEALKQINPAARLLSNQSRHLAELRDRGFLDGFAHMELQKLLHELMTQQGKAERIKNFPFPRQYATVNSYFALMFAVLVPFGMLPEFAKLGDAMVWATIPFSGLVSWVFLTTDKIGDYSENPFEGLTNDVPITSMSRGIERDIRQMVDEDDLPPPREHNGPFVT